jgi:hypothetical protein
MRFLVEVSDDWRVQVSVDRGGRKTNICDPRQLDFVTDDGGWKFPVPPGGDINRFEELSPADLLANPDAHRLDDAHSAIAARNAAHIEQFGNYLFVTLLDKDWQEIRRVADDAEQGVELALSWSASDGSLNRLYWEMMHSGRQFLAAGGADHAVITRVVRGARAGAPPTIDFPPRVLFVVGTSLVDQTIRPAAEISNILRELSDDATGGQRILYRYLENANPRRIAAAVRKFRPQLVHYMCHGEVDPETHLGFLELQPDEPGGPSHFGAEQLLEHLRGPDDELPAIVIVSACKTAGGSRYARGTLAGPQDSAPLAAELVAGGIPVVVGMAGRVADRAARLFTVRFGEALLSGEPLVRATAAARRVGYSHGESPRQSVDWAFPAVFTAPSVDSDYTAVQTGAAAKMHTLNEWLDGYLPQEDPVFCGREEFVQAFHELFTRPDSLPPRRQVLAAWSSEEPAKLGRSRLLKQLATLALREGHIPMLVPLDRGDARRDLATFVRNVHKALTKLRSDGALGLALTAASQLEILSAPVSDALERDDLHRAVREELEEAGVVTPAAVNLALAEDLATLLADAQRGYPEIVGPTRQVVLLIDDLHMYGPMLEHFFNGVLSRYGAGSKRNPVPVVVSFQRSSAPGADEFLKPVAEDSSGVPWVEALPVLPWRNDGEDMLAYEHVLMNPWRKHDPDGIVNTPWAFNDEANERIRNIFEKMFRSFLEGSPNVVYTGGALKSITKLAADEDFVVEADDADCLERARG